MFQVGFIGENESLFVQSGTEWPKSVTTDQNLYKFGEIRTTGFKYTLTGLNL